MKIFVLPAQLTKENGYGRYSIDVIDALKRAGIEVVVADVSLPKPLNYRRNYFLAFWYAWKLIKYAKNSDVIHSFIEPYSHIAYWLSKFIGKKYIITAHGTYGVLPYHQSFWKRYFHNKSFSNAYKIVCVSQYTKKILSDFGLKRLQVISNGISFYRFYKEPVPGFNSRKNIILSVGNLKYRKGQHVALEAFAKVSKKIIDSKLYIVGDQSGVDYFDQLKKATSDFGLENRISFLSSLGDDELLNLYQKAKVFILTSLSEHNHFEGFGLVYLEANALGTPVIGSFNSGAEDAIQNGKTGLLVPQNDIQASGDAIIRLLNDRNLWEGMSKEGLVWSKKHNWSEVIKEYIKLYKSTSC